MCDARDSTLEALSDGLYVAPAIETADYHASLNKNSWFYVFDYQSKYGDYTTVRYDQVFFLLGGVSLIVFNLEFARGYRGILP